MKLIFSLLLCSLCCVLFSQSKVDFGRVDDDQLNERLTISGEALTKYIHDDIPQEYLDQMTDRAAYRFADQAARASVNILSSGRVYSIIGHELAHYELRHGLERYVKSENGEFDGSILFNARKAASAFSVDNELDSDSRAAEHLRRAGYDLSGLAETFSVFKRQEDRALLQREDVWELKETTHPSSGRRIDRIREMMATETQTMSTEPASTALFEKLREEARAEVLKYLLAGFNYQSCLEKAWAEKGEDRGAFLRSLPAGYLVHGFQ